MTFWTVLGLTMLPVIANGLGGVLSECVSLTGRRVNRALHAAAGIVLSVVAVELMPRALEGAPGWVIATAFTAGGLTATGLRAMLHRRSADSRVWMIYAAVAVDLFSDGLMIGTGATVAADLALLLALGQVLADAPEGFASSAALRDAVPARSRRALVMASFALPAGAGAMIGWFLLRDAAEAAQMAGLVFAAGLLVVAAVEDMLGEAHEAAEDRAGSAIAFVGGFALFVLTASYGG